MSDSEPRIPMVPASEWNDEIFELFAVMEGPAVREKGPSRTVVQYLAQHPTLSAKFLEFGKQLLMDSNLSDRDRELVTLYVAWTTKSDYEWASHVAFGLRIGLTDADIDAVKQGPGCSHWSDKEKNLFLAVDQMRDNFEVDDQLWEALSKELNLVQMVELMFTIGNYVLASAVFNSLRIPLEAADPAIIEKYGSTRD